MKLHSVSSDFAQKTLLLTSPIVERYLDAQATSDETMLEDDFS